MTQHSTVGITSKMTGLQTFLMLSLGITMAVAWDPDCYLCEYYNGIGYVKSQDYCHVYYMCIRNYGYGGYNYTWYTMCCEWGQTFDEDHLTCVRGYGPPNCDPSHYKCPGPRKTTDMPCPYKPYYWDPTKYYVPTGEVMMCPYGQIWNQVHCTCILDEGNAYHDPPCDKILHYKFTGTYDSWSCYNHASGEPYGDPPLDGDMLCLNGVDQFLTIPYLNNWFAWNPIGTTFTLCFWFRPYPGQTAGVLSTNCYYDTGAKASVAEVILINGDLVVCLGEAVYYLGIYPEYIWNKLCIVFVHGHYWVFFNGRHVYDVWQDVYPVNSHSATTLGFVRGRPTFKGYFDDFCFWTSALDSDYITRCYRLGPSNGPGMG